MDQTPPPTRPPRTLADRAHGWRDWWPEVLLGSGVLVLGAVEVVPSLQLVRERGFSPLPSMLVVVLIAAAVSSFRKLPGAGLALLWLLVALHLLTGTPILTIELAVAVVAFGCARWGSTGTLVASGLSLPLVAGVAILVFLAGYYGLVGFTDSQVLLDAGRTFTDTTRSGVLLLGVIALVLPWAAGLVARATARARRSDDVRARAEKDAERAQRETDQAQEIAELRDQQARMAHDVHDVVGHSLAVILAQAESGQYLPDDSPDRLKQTLATIATSARSSLREVRQVLGAAQDPTRETDPGALALDTLLDGVRASGHEVVSRELGTPQPMPPDVEVVAYRVLQEMLTNAIRHGRRDAPVHVERLWPDGSLAGELRLEVRNVVAAAGAAGGAVGETRPLHAIDTTDRSDLLADDVGGQGVLGMRRRLESAGGRLDVRRREEPDGDTFTATAWLPVRTVSR